MSSASRLALLLVALAGGGVSCASVGRPPTAYARRNAHPSVDQSEPCDALLSTYDDDSAFKLVFRPDTGSWRRQSQTFMTDVVGAHPTPGQRIVVCIESCGGSGRLSEGCTDYRDSFDVEVGVANEDLSTIPPVQSGDVGADTEISATEVLANSVQATLGAALGRMSTAAVQATIAAFCTMAGTLPTGCGSLATHLGTAIVPVSAAGDGLNAGELDLLDVAASAAAVGNDESIARARAVLSQLIFELYAVRLLSQAAALESQRTQVLTNVMDMFQRPIREPERVALRDLLARLVLPGPDTEQRLPLNTSQTFSVPVPTSLDPAERISFSGRINLLLPKYIWLTDGRLVIYLPDPGQLPGADGAPAVDPLEPVRDAIRPAVEALTEGIARTWRLATFMNDALSRLHQPRRVWDLSSFSANRLVSIKVRRQQRVIEFANGQLELRSRDSTATRLEEVHGLDRVRIEPGFAVSTRANPQFRIEQNAAGASVIGQSTSLESQLFLAVFVHVTFCDLDLRTAPLYRVCNSGDILAHPQWMSILRNVGLSVGITPTPAIYKNLFLGLDIQLAPYFTLSGGAHFGAWRSLSPGRQLGDPFTGTQADLDAITHEEFGVAGYFSVTLGEDILSRLRGFNLQ